MLSDWVQGGGNLIAMRPDKQLAGLLGLDRRRRHARRRLPQGRHGVGPGAGIVGQTMQFHGTADRYTLERRDARSRRSTRTRPRRPSNPAVTLRSVGANGGQAAAFTYDLARSVVYTRQGNPAWAGQERDGDRQPIRSDDLFFGAAGDVSPTGSTSTRSRSRRPTSSSGCSPT